MLKLPFRHPAILWSEIPKDGSRHPDDSARTTVQEFQKALLPLKADIFTFPFPCNKKDFIRFIGFLESRRTDYVFNFCEELNNDSSYEGNMAAFLELLGIPYSGSPSEALYFCRDKFRVNALLRSAGIPVPWGYAAYEIKDLKKPESPVILKPACEDGSLGLSRNCVCRDLKGLKKAFQETRKTVSGPLLVEEYIEGREVNVSVLRGNAFAFSEVHFAFKDKSHPNILTYEAKWDAQSPVYRESETRCPARLRSSLKTKLKQNAEKIFSLLKLKDYARVDFRIDHLGNPFVIDVNPNPCIAPDSGFVKALTHKKINIKKMIESFFKI